jgi:hypothetical protein
MVNGQFGDDNRSEVENAKEPEEIVVTMDDATRMQAIANSPEWAKEVWEKFNEYEDPVTIWIGDSYAGFMDRVVYDSGNGQKVTNFPAMDYDGDGTLDRIYGDISINTEGESIYLFSGNGELLLLGEPYWSFLGSTYSADLTGDGKNELIYITHVSGSGGETFVAAAWERIDGRWDKMDITPSGDSGLDNAGNLHTLTLPIQVEKTGENRIRLTQPEVGKSFEHEVTHGYMSDLWSEMREDNQPYVTEIRSDNISVVKDPNTGKSYFQVLGGYGNKWYSVPCGWLLGYEDGGWKILDFWNEGERALKQKLTDTLWQRMVSMVLNLAPSDRDDWLAYWSGDNQVEMILGNFNEEYHDVWTEGKDSPWGRSYQVNAAYDRDKAYNTGWYWIDHYHDLSLAELCENADNYLAYSYSHHGAYYYSEELFAKHRSEGLLMVTGALKREIYPAGETFLNQREIEGEYIDLWNAVMGAVSELYLEEQGSIPGRMVGEAYLMNFDPKTLTAEFWICLDGQRTLYMTANYTVESCGWTLQYEGDKSYFDPGYVYGFDETYVFSGGWNEENIHESAWLGLEFDLTTERLAE